MTIQEDRPLGLAESTRVTQQYESRFLMMGILNREIAAKQFKEKPDEECQKDLDFLISQYNSGVDFTYLYLETYISRYQNALAAIAFNARVEYAAKAFRDLLKATKPDRRSTKEVSLTDRFIILREAYDEIFAPALDTLVTAGENGGIQACLDILTCFSGDVPPLLSYTDRTIARVSEPTGVKGKITFHDLPTKIPNVDARYSYDSVHEMPEVSFIIRPFN